MWRIWIGRMSGSRRKKRTDNGIKMKTLVSCYVHLYEISACSCSTWNALFSTFQGSISRELLLHSYEFSKIRFFCSIPELPKIAIGKKYVWEWPVWVIRHDGDSSPTVALSFLGRRYSCFPQACCICLCLHAPLSMFFHLVCFPLSLSLCVMLSLSWILFPPA